MATKKAPGKARKKPAGKPAAKKAAPAGLKLDEVSTSFTANDLAKSLAWYRDVVGFTVEERYEREGKLVGVGLRAGKVFLMLGQDDWKKGRDRKKGEGFRLYLMTSQDVDAIAKGIVTRGGVLDQGPTNQPWGMRDFSLTDPDGFKITIGADKKRR